MRESHTRRRPRDASRELGGCVRGGVAWRVLILVSYVPLLHGFAGQLLTPDAVEPLLDTDAGHVDAILWAADHAGRFSLVLAMARAVEVFEHLVEWSEGSPATWFKLLYDESDDEYAMALVPDVRRSLDRFRLAHFLATGVEASHDEVQVVFQPLLFRGPKSDVTRRALPRLGQKVTVGFVDLGALRGGLAGIDPRTVSNIGPLHLERDANLLART